MTTPAGSRGSGVDGAEAGARAERRSRSVAERQRIVDAALAPDASVAGVARANGVNANLVFNGSVDRGKAGAIVAVARGSGGRRSDVFAGSQRKPEVRSRPPCCAGACGGETGAA